MKLQPAEAWRVHDLKTWPRSFRALLLDRKHVEVRRHDRDFQVGDVLILREYDPGKKEYTHRFLIRVVVAVNRLDVPQLEGFSALEVRRPENVP